MIAINMEMPKSCEDCPMNVHWSGDMDYCKLCDKGNKMDCPLVEIITCKDCKHRIGCKCESLNLIVGDNGYCSNGERRE